MKYAVLAGVRGYLVGPCQGICTEKSCHVTNLVLREVYLEEGMGVRTWKRGRAIQSHDSRGGRDREGHRKAIHGPLGTHTERKKEGREGNCGRKQSLSAARPSASGGIGITGDNANCC